MKIATTLLVIACWLHTTEGILCDIFGIGCPLDVDVCGTVARDCPSSTGDIDVCGTVAADCAPPQQPTDADICSAVNSTCPPPTLDICGTVATDCAPPQPTEAEICSAVDSTCPPLTVDVCGKVESDCAPPQQPTDAEICSAVSTTCPPPATPSPMIQCENRFDVATLPRSDLGTALRRSGVWSPCLPGEFRTACFCSAGPNQFTELFAVPHNSNRCACEHENAAPASASLFAICCRVV